MATPCSAKALGKTEECFLARSASGDSRHAIIDGLVKSHQSRHPGESRGPEVLVFAGFRLSPE
jgi:hypothetical protein